jgi:hypothetical protein
MPSKHKLLPVRTSTTLRTLIDQAGPVNAATRALIILGADAAGLDLFGVEREAAALLAVELAPGVAEGLRRVVGRGRALAQAIPLVSRTRSLTATSQAQEVGPDGLEAVGWEV